MSEGREGSRDDPDLPEDVEDLEHQPAFVEEELLDHPVRTSMVETIRERPGINKHQLSREIGRKPSNVDHHVEILEEHGVLATRSPDNEYEIHCFVDGDERYWEIEPTRSLYGRSGTRDVALHLAENPGARTREIAEALGCSMSAVRRNLRTLQERDLVRRHRAGRTFLYDADRILRTWVEEVGEGFERPWEG